MGVVFVPVALVALLVTVYGDEIDEWLAVPLEPADIRLLVPNAARELYEPNWTSDGTAIVFGYSRRYGFRDVDSIYIVDAEGTQLRTWIPEDAPQDPDARLAYDVAPHVNPVTSQIVYATLRDRGGDLQIARAELDGSGYRRLTESDANDLAPAWSPNGTRIAFVSNRGDRGFRVFIMDADGSNVGEVGPHQTSVLPYRPLWSPDGAHLAFRSDYLLHTYTVASDRLVPYQRLFTLGLTKTDPAWSPDGQWLAFSHREPIPDWPMRSETIYMVRSDPMIGPDSTPGRESKEVIRLARESGESIYLDNLSWTPDGTALRFTAFMGDNTYALYQVLTDGSGLTEIAKMEWRPRIAWSPDGSRVAVVDDRIGSHRDGLVYTMAVDGSDKRTIVVEGPYGPAAANRG